MQASGDFGNTLPGKYEFVDDLVPSLPEVDFVQEVTYSGQPGAVLSPLHFASVKLTFMLPEWARTARTQEAAHKDN